MSLENCPGRNDFRLTIPSESSATVLRFGVSGLGGEDARPDLQ